MLYQLIQYAQAQGLSGRPGYVKKRIRAIVTVGLDGAIRAETADLFSYAPSLSQPELIGKGGIRSHFLADAMSTATGLNADNKHSTFVALHMEAARHVPGLAPLAAALSDPNGVQTMQRLLTEINVKPTDIITFRLSGNDRPLIESDFWQAWWDGHRASLRQRSDDGQQMRCLATGELVEPALTQPKLKLMSIGGQGAGSTLIGFDKDAFTSYGLKQAQNAACSEEAAAVYADALTDLIQKAPRPLAGMLLLHWFERSIPPENDIFGLFAEQNENDETAVESAMQAARRLVNAVHEGKRPELQHNRYHVILLAAEAGRAKVRSTFEGTLSELYESFKKWFDDLSIIAPYGTVSVEPPKLYAVLMRLLRYRPNAKPSEISDAMEDLAPTTVRIWDSILTSAPFPQAAASMALNNLRSRLLRSREEDRDHGPENIDRIAVSILKLWYNRAVRAGLLIKGGVTVEEKLNINYPDPAYHAGRLLAVLNNLQHRALGNVQADIVQRFYSSASVTPGLVIGRLIDGAQPHLNKLRRSDAGAIAFWYEKLIAEIMQKIGTPAPNQLDFAGQTLFSLGYYHQFSALFEKNTQAKKDKEAASNGTEESL